MILCLMNVSLINNNRHSFVKYFILEKHVYSVYDLLVCLELSLETFAPLGECHVHLYSLWPDGT